MKRRERKQAGNLGGAGLREGIRNVKENPTGQYTRPYHATQTAQPPPDLGLMIDQCLASVDEHESAFWQHIRLAAEHRYQANSAKAALRSLETMLPLTRSPA